MAITVGGDPEFLVVNNYGTTQHFGINHTDDHGNIGSDHGGSVGELRPKFGTPAQVTENIRAQMVYIKSYLPEGQKIVAGGGRGLAGGYNAERYRSGSIGGHIHFGGLRLANPYDSFTRQRNRLRLRGQPPNYVHSDRKLVVALDFFIGGRMKRIPGGKRPSGSSYGKLSDIETKPYGFEYRTPPSWLSDPFLTESTLAIAQRIVEMWSVKPTCFDYLFGEGEGAKKRSARRRDYDVLIPSDRTRAYFVEQLRRFRKVAFSKTYNMSDGKVLEYWTNPAAVAKLYGQSDEPAVKGAITTRTRRGTVKIELQICQLKFLDRTSDFESETVAGVCRFGLPEVKVYGFNEYTPWQFQLTRDVRLRPNTIYFAKELRPFLKIKRGGDYRCRFIEMRQRAVNTNGQTTTTDLTNCVFFNSTRSNVEIKNRIIEIFNNCARTKLRNADGIDDSGDDSDDADDNE